MMIGVNRQRFRSVLAPGPSWRPLGANLEPSWVHDGSLLSFEAPLRDFALKSFWIELDLLVRFRACFSSEASIRLQTAMGCVTSAASDEQLRQQWAGHGSWTSVQGQAAGLPCRRSSVSGVEGGDADMEAYKLKEDRGLIKLLDAKTELEPILESPRSPGTNTH